MPPQAKSKLLHTEAKIRMETTVAQARMESNSRRSTSNRQPDDRVLPAGKTRVLMHSPERPGRHSSHSAGPSRLASSSGPSGTSSHHSTGVRGLLDSLFGSEGASSSTGDTYPPPPPPLLQSFPFDPKPPFIPPPSSPALLP